MFTQATAFVIIIMGCNWQIFVQGLFEVDNDDTDDDDDKKKKQESKKQWITLGDSQYDKTGCGGNPVRFVMRKYIEACNENNNNHPTTMMGSFGEEFPIQNANHDPSNHWSVTQTQKELNDLDEKHDPDTGEVKAKRHKKEEKAVGKQKEEYLEPEEALAERAKLVQQIESNSKKITKHGLLEEDSYPEWECFHMTISEYQGLCDALLDGEYAYSHYDTYAGLLQWADVLDNFQRAPPSTTRASPKSLLRYRHRHSSGMNEEDYVLEQVKAWKDNLENNRVAKQMMPQVCQHIGCQEEQVGRTILGFCGNNSPPMDLRFTIHCEEGHLEYFRKGDMRGAHEFDGSCCVM